MNNHQRVHGSIQDLSPLPPSCHGSWKSSFWKFLTVPLVSPMAAPLADTLDPPSEPFVTAPTTLTCLSTLQRSAVCVNKPFKVSSLVHTCF
ncbi:hypothetical protein AMECASPLE_030245 [Ameca splendens]|uniref:Uncharacterized protein n=1 Tax=Ameca splendens TaxID=208324 RepID=A0ABV0YH33_9TELE